MNWTTLLRFRKQVEDLASEGVVLAEWEKSQVLTKRFEVSHEMEAVVTELEEQIQIGIDTLVAEERYRWLDQLGTAMEERTQEIQRLEETLVGLREKLKKAYHARRALREVANHVPAPLPLSGELEDLPITWLLHCVAHQGYLLQHVDFPGNRLRVVPLWLARTTPLWPITVPEPTTKESCVD